MRLEHLWIREFRGLTDVSFSLEPATVLIGPNNAGKSMILDAICFLVGTRDRFGRPFAQSAVGDARVIGRFVDLTPQEEADWVWWIQDGAVLLGARFAETEGTSDHVGVFAIAPLTSGVTPGSRPPIHDEAGQGWFRPERPIRPDERHRHELGVELIGLDGPALVMLPGPEAGTPDIGSLLEPLLYGVYLDIAEDLADQINPLLERLTRGVIAPVRQGLNASLPRYLPSVRGAYLAASFTYDRDITSDELREALLGDLRVWSVSRPLSDEDLERDEVPELAQPMGLAGAGAQRALALAVLELYWDPELMFDGSVVVAVEEPEVGLHPGAQRQVARALASVPTSLVQTIVITHSPTLIDAAPPSGIRIVRATEEGMPDGTIAIRREVLIPTALEEIIGAVGASPSDILLGDRFVVVEGTSDARVLEVWAARRGFDLAASKVKIYPAGGWATTEGLAKFVEVAYPGGRFFVLLDDGPDTRRAAHEMAARFKSQVEVIVLSRPEIESFYSVTAVLRWLGTHGVDVSAGSEASELVRQGGVNKRALQRLSKRLLQRNFRVVDDGVLIARLMGEHEIPAEIVDALMRVTAR